MRGQSKLIAGDNGILIVPALTAYSTPVATNTQLHNTAYIVNATGVDKSNTAQGTSL